MTRAELLGRLVDTVLDRSVAPGYTRAGYLVRSRLPGWPADPPPDALAGRAAIVTGAGSGLGRAAAAGLGRLGATVHLVVRNTAKGDAVAAELSEQAPSGRFRVWRCDVSDLDDVRRMAAEFTAAESSVDALVHNAGVMPRERSRSAQGHELSMATHVLGPLRMTESLLPALGAGGGARVVLVSSGGMYAQRLPVDDLEYTEGAYRGATAYARTKRVQIALLPAMAQRWAGTGVSVHAAHPGWADTPGVVDSLPGFHRLTSRVLRTPEEGADTVVWLAGTPAELPSGRFWHDRRPRPAHLLPWTRDTEEQRKAVWEWCARAADLRP